MQREVETVPLMLVEGYRADGWLGMLMGPRLWYGVFGSVRSGRAVAAAWRIRLLRQRLVEEPGADAAGLARRRRRARGVLATKSESGSQ